MRPEGFVQLLRTEVVDSNMRIYAELLQETDRSKVSDEYWRSTLALYDSLSENERRTLMMIMRQSAVDAISTILGILDGTVLTKGGLNDIKLLDESDHKLNGDLQDYFLASEDD